MSAELFLEQHSGPHKEARDLVLMVQSGRVTAEEIRKLLTITERDREIMKRFAASRFIEEQISFRAEVRVHFERLLVVGVVRKSSPDYEARKLRAEERARQREERQKRDRDIRRRAALGESFSDIARALKLSRARAQRIASVKNSYD